MSGALEKNVRLWQMQTNSQVLFSVALLAMLSIFCVARFFSLQDQVRLLLTFALSTILPLIYIYLNRFKELCELYEKTVSEIIQLKQLRKLYGEIESKNDSINQYN